MRVVEISRPGGPEVLEIVERPLPAPGPGEVLLRVLAASVNRPDVQQRRGLYPPPPDASPVPGLDAAGRIAAVGAGVTGFAEGDAVCALTNGGAYADYCLVPALQCMPVPEGLSFIEAASLPEAFFTVWNNVVWLGRLAEGETLLVQGGSSGVGLAAIQVARALRGARVFATAGSAEKRDACLAAGAAAAFDYRGDWAGEISRLAGEHCIDVALDGQAGPYAQQQLDLLAPDGRLVFIASHQSATAEVNVRDLVRRRLTMTGSTLRPRTAAYKGRIARELVEHVWPLLADGRITTRIHATFPLEAVREAHGVLDANAQIGKVVLVMDPALAAERPAPAAAAPAAPRPLSAARVTAWLAGLFAAAGVAPEAAGIAAGALVESDLDGVPSHGILQAPIYLRRLMAGSVSTASAGTRVHESEAVAVYDGAVALGALTAAQAMEDAIGRARRHGIAAVAVRRGFHFGAAGRYARMASEAGLIGLAMCNSRAMMPAPGGAEPVVGNNPLALALPTTDGVPLVLDMAMSETSIGRIRVAAARGETLPEGWALDASGAPTTDPAAALKGMLVPIAGAKGFGLALMIDMMASILAQGAGGTAVTSFYENIEASAHCSYLFIAIDPAHFGLARSFGDTAAEAAQAVRSARRAAGTDRIFTPGERRAARRAAAGDTIAPSPSVIAELNALARRLGAAPLED